jgi:peptidoglycan/xylan/chitin deacetylase (PgdA/CDA1 family)
MLIVTYHAIGGPPSAVCATPAQLEADLSGLADLGFAFVSLDDCAEWLAGRRALPERSAAVTFDDAYASVVSNGLPVLRRLHVPATVFVIAGRIGGDNRWRGQWRSIPSMPLADTAGLRELTAAGIAIGSHTSSHALLTAIDRETLRAEVEESADRLEQTLAVPVRHFAYPYGARGPREIAAAKQRYRTAVNAEPRVATRDSNPHDLCRVDGHDLRVALGLKAVGPRVLRPYLAVRRSVRRLRRSADGWLGRI